MPIKDEDTTLRIYREELADEKPARKDTKEEAELRKQIRKEIDETDGVMEVPSEWIDIDD